MAILYIVLLPLIFGYYLPHLIVCLLFYHIEYPLLTLFTILVCCRCLSSSSFNLSFMSSSALIIRFFSLVLHSVYVYVFIIILMIIIFKSFNNNLFYKMVHLLYCNAFQYNWERKIHVYPLSCYVFAERLVVSQNFRWLLGHWHWIEPTLQHWLLKTPLNKHGLPFLITVT